MRITREILLKVTRDTVVRMTRADRGIVSIFMTGSLLGEDYLLGGTGDIDLVVIHSDLRDQEREVRPVTEEVHLDIAHELYRDYRQPRKLRVHPWMGPVIDRCEILYDPQHFLEFTKASVRGQFNTADHVIQRARPQAEHARQIWLELYQRLEGKEALEGADPAIFLKYLRSLDHAANAIADLGEGPLTERRFLLGFRQRAQAVGREGLFPGILGLLGGAQVKEHDLQPFLESWQTAYQALPESQRPDRLHPVRCSYYRRGMEALLAGEEPRAMLWPLFRTWTLAMANLPADSEHRVGWENAMGKMGLAGAGFQERVTAMDGFLDVVEETLEAWAHQNGAAW